MGSTIISKDGETLYYLAAFEGGYDLWKMNLRKKETRLLHKMDAGWADMQLDKDGKSLFLLGSRKMQKMDTSSDALTPITFQVDAKMDLAAEREYMFDHVYRQQSEAILQYQYARSGLGQDDRRLSPLPAPYQQQL